MDFGKVKGKLKGLIRKGEEKKYGMPPEYLMVRWREEGEVYDLYGKEGKEIILISNEEMERTYPYSRNLLGVLRKRMNLPILDMTEGRDEPEEEVGEMIDPGKIERR